MKKKLLATFIIASCLTALAACGEKKEEPVNVDPEEPKEEEAVSDCRVFPIDFGVTKTVATKDEAATYLSGVATDNRPVEDGIILSPYFNKLTVNDVEVPVYATRTAFTIHSFAYIDIEKGNVNKLHIVLEGSPIKKSFTKVDVLPLSKGVKATFEKKVIKATLDGTGNYSFAFNGKQEEALTIMVTEKDSPNNYLTGEITRTIQEIEPGDYYGENNLSLEETNKVYFFKKGNYQIGRIDIPDKSILYFEEGAYLKLYPDSTHPIYSNKVDDIGISGHGLIDFSACNGSQLGSTKDDRAGKSGLSFNYSNKLSINGLMLINAQTWQCCLNCSTNIHITNCMFYGYRTYADGIMLNNCQDAVVEYNFIRTGDDGFETKSTSGDMLTKNVVFQYNSAWTDKAVAYGCIYESKNDTSDVHFLHNSVGFANGNWSKHLGCAVIQMGNNPNATMYNIEFDDMEIYYSVNQAMCNIYIGGSGGMGAGSGTARDIYFKNIRCDFNAGYMLNLQTYDSDNCFIKKVYMDNIVSNKVQLTAENYKEYCCMDKVVGGYNPGNLTINGVKCK